MATYDGIDYRGIDLPDLISGDVVNQCIFSGSDKFDPIFQFLVGVTFNKTIFYDCLIPQGCTYNNCAILDTPGTNTGFATDWKEGLADLPAALQYSFMYWIALQKPNFSPLNKDGYDIIYWLVEDPTVTDLLSVERYRDTKVIFWGLDYSAIPHTIKKYSAVFEGEVGSVVMTLSEVAE